MTATAVPTHTHVYPWILNSNDRRRCSVGENRMVNRRFSSTDRRAICRVVREVESNYVGVFLVALAGLVISLVQFTLLNPVPQGGQPAMRRLAPTVAAYQWVGFHRVSR